MSSQQKKKNAAPATPIMSELKEESWTPKIKQCTVTKLALEIIKPLMDVFLKNGLIWPCQSPYNAPIFPCAKSGVSENRLVQTLRVINQIIKDIHLMLPNFLHQPPHSGDFC